MAKSNTWKKKRRKEYLEQKQFRYYIFCEGQKTEPNYFESFKRIIEDNPIYKDMILIEIKPCQAETMRVLNKAIDYVKDNNIESGQVWCVYDKDSFSASDFNGVVIKEKNLNQVNDRLQYYSGWSNECIEFWFLLHFSYYTSNNSREKYVEYLNRKFVELGLSKYQKNMNNIFDVLLEYGNPKLAIKYAKRILKDSQGALPSDICPGTNVHELVLELAKYLPEDLKNKFI